MSIPLLLLHGALGAEDQMMPLKDQLTSAYSVHTINFSSHGGKPVTDASYRIKHFAIDVLSWMAEKDYEQINIFGYSMGGYVGMYLARHYPDKINKIFTLATKYVWDELSTARELRMLNAQKIKEKVPKFAAMLEKRHAPQSWELILEKTGEMMKAISVTPPLVNDDYARIPHSVMIAVGDQDTTAGLEDSVAIFRQLSNAQLWVIPATSHPLEKVNHQLLVSEIDQFFHI